MKPIGHSAAERKTSTGQPFRLSPLSVRARTARLEQHGMHTNNSLSIDAIQFRLMETVGGFKSLQGHLEFADKRAGQRLVSDHAMPDKLGFAHILPTLLSHRNAKRTCQQG